MRHPPGRGKEKWRDLARVVAGGEAPLGARLAFHGRMPYVGHSRQGYPARRRGVERVPWNLIRITPA